MRRVLTSGIFVVFCFLTITILAQVPQLLNYQGRLTDDKGIPIITPTTVRFSLYQGGDAATPGSGTLCYQEDASVTPDDNGVFSHLIGSGTVIFGALDSTVFQTADPVYLEITIDPAGANETLLPRKQIVTVGYSFKSELADDADTVDGQDASAFAPVVHNHDPAYVNEGQANSVDSAMIVNGTIVDADINAGANIAGSKIDPTGLDADLLDGQDSEDFVHTAGDDMTGTLSVTTTGALYALYVEEQSSSGTNYAVWGQSNSTSGWGVLGFATATSGLNYGVHGRSDSTNGRGVYALAAATTGTNYGLYGVSNSIDGRGVYGTAPNYGVYGEATASSGTAYGIYGKTDSSDGYGVYGFASDTTGYVYGVYGESNSPNGSGVYGTAPLYGVYGEASATSDINYGVYGRSTSTSGMGVHGFAFSYTGHTYGVYGESQSPDGYGVYGQAPTRAVYGRAYTGEGITYGVYGMSASPDGYGVYGVGTATTGDAYGVYGRSNSNSGYGVYGTAPTNGVYGVATATSGYGVYGYAEATSGSNNGVFGKSDSTSGTGVWGHATASSGTNYGVRGYSDSTIGKGVYGSAPNYGVYGWAFADTGVNYGVYGRSNSASGYAGYFQGNAHVTGNLTVDGSKTCVQPIDNGKKVLLYAMESPEIWFEDFGTGKLVNGQAVVQLESVFTQAANTEIAYFVFPIPNGDCNGLYIARQDKDAFEVRELGGGTSNISFNYRIVAKRRGYEEVRFEEFTEHEQPPEQANRPVERK